MEVNELVGDILPSGINLADSLATPWGEKGPLGITTISRDSGRGSSLAPLATLTTDTDVETPFRVSSRSTEIASNEADEGLQTFLSPMAVIHETIDSLTRTSTAAQLVGGNIQVTPPNPEIVQNRMVFSTVNEEIRPAKTLRISNTGDGPLTIDGLEFGNKELLGEADFELVNSPGSFTLEPGASRNLSVRFVPKGADKFASLNFNDSPTHTKNGEQYDSLVITSSDQDQGTVMVNLAGLNSANYEGNNEPALAEIARTYGFTFNVGKEDNVLGGSKTLLGNEVYSPYWLHADTSKPVELWPLAVYSGRSDTPHDSIRFEAKPRSGGNSGLIYELAGRLNDDGVPGSNDLSGGENQKLLPKIFVDNDGDGDRENVAPRPETVDFNPTKPFALNRGASWTDDSKNGSRQLHNWRMYPVGDPSTTTTWFAAADPGNNPDPSTGKNFDYNDDVYLLVNARPEAPQKPALYRIDSGSSLSYVDTSGKPWGPDTGFANGVAENGGSPPPAIANTDNDILYQTYRGKVETLSYNLPISSPQKVNLYLHFAELYWGVKADTADGGKGSRIFDVIAEGTTVLDNFDIATAAGGPRTAFQKAINGVSVTDGNLDLDFVALPSSGGKDFPAISAISVLPAS